MSYSVATELVCHQPHDTLLQHPAEEAICCSSVAACRQTQRTPEDPTLLHVYVDADACPVKKETFKVAARYGLEVTLVANSWMRVPFEPWIHLQVVEGGLDVADDWIAERAQTDDVVITADIPLANRCLQAGAAVLGTSGRVFTEDNIGDALATRDLLTELRSGGEKTGGPPPITQRDRSLFLQKLDETIQRIRRRAQS